MQNENLSKYTELKCLPELRDSFQGNRESEKNKQVIFGHKNALLPHWMCSRLPDMVPENLIFSLKYDCELESRSSYQDDQQPEKIKDDAAGCPIWYLVTDL